VDGAGLQPGAAYAVKARWPPFGEPSMHNRGRLLRIIVTVVVKIKVKMRR
jgi:hypothetical protein